MVMMEKQVCFNFAHDDDTLSSTPATTTGGSFSFNPTPSSNSATSTTNATPQFGSSTTAAGTTTNNTSFCFGTSALNTPQASFGSTNSTSTDNNNKSNQGGFGFGTCSFNKPTITTTNNSNQASGSFGSTNTSGFSTISFPISTTYSGEYITLTGPNNIELIKKCTNLCDVDIKIFTNDKLVTTMTSNRLLLLNISGKLDELMKNKCIRDGEKFVLTISTEEFEPSIGKFDALVLNHFIECIVKGTTQLHINQSFHLLVLLNHLDMIPTMRILRSLMCQTFSRHCALLFVTNFNTYYTEGHTYSVELMSLFFTALNNVINGIDNISNQIGFGKIHQNLLERFLSSTSKTASLRCILQAIDIWFESNKSVASDPIQVVTLLDSIHLESPKDHSQIIASLSCYPSRFQFLNSMDTVMRLKLIHKHALHIK